MTDRACGSISLYRHGKVEFDQWQWAKCKDFRTLVRSYDNGPVKAGSDHAGEPSPDLIVVSSLSRSKKSANDLFGRYDVSLAIFREAELLDLPPLSMKLPAVIWFLLARFLWLCGASNNYESHSCCRKRAIGAAHFLIAQVNEGKDVALIGHTILNRMISAELRNQRFSGPKRPTNAHWKKAVYRRQK